MKQHSINFITMYNQYYKDVYTFSLWLCKNKENAKDITSETFVRAWTSKARIDYTTVKAYLLKIARNLFLHLERSKREFIEVDDNVEASFCTEWKLQFNEVMNQIEEFNEPDKTIFLMKAYQGLSYQEISEVMNISVSACKVKVFRARKKLISELEKEKK